MVARNLLHFVLVVLVFVLLYLLVVYKKRVWDTILGYNLVITWIRYLGHGSASWTQDFSLVAGKCSKIKLIQRCHKWICYIIYYKLFFLTLLNPSLQTVSEVSCWYTFIMFRIMLLKVKYKIVTFRKFIVQDNSKHFQN